MSTEFNHRLISATRDVLSRYFLTAVRYPGQCDGLTAFDLNDHSVMNNHVVTLDAAVVGRSYPLMGFWVPQGGSCVIPANPGTQSFVFTPDFSGCSILVDQIDANQYMVYHVQGGSNYLQKEYRDAYNRHGLGLAASMIFDDYGDAPKPRGFAFLKYENGRWWIYYQRHNGIGINYSKGRFHTMGPQTVRGGGRIPVADLTSEVPRINGRHSGQHLPVTRNIQVAQRMLPNDEIW
ncbi:hypothetical protein RVW77_004567 [Citrobacter braakii]|nr:hypothetical protein [Citrobacter braakii]